jgi:putative component of membrane protein insertase Oxa1/YidC/SpoIIIJ protein YidD
METESLLPCSQESYTGPCPEPDKSNPYQPIQWEQNSLYQRSRSTQKTSFLWGSLLTVWRSLKGSLNKGYNAFFLKSGLSSETCIKLIKLHSNNVSAQLANSEEFFVTCSRYWTSFSCCVHFHKCVIEEEATRKINCQSLYKFPGDVRKILSAISIGKQRKPSGL